MFRLRFHLYGLWVGIGACFVLFFAYEKSKELQLKEKIVDFCFLISAVLAIVFARLYHVLHYWNYYSLSLKEIFNLQAGGLGIFGAIFGIVLGLFFCSLIFKVNLKILLDLFLPGLLFAQGVGRIGNFFNQDILSQKTLPLSLIESFFCFSVFFIYRKINQKKKISGTGFYFLSYGLIRFLTEFFRIDTWQAGGVKIAHIISLLFILLGFGVLKRDIFN